MQIKDNSSADRRDRKFSEYAAVLVKCTRSVDPGCYQGQEVQQRIATL